MAEAESPLLNHKEEGIQEKALSFVRRFGFESKKLWVIAGPAIFTSLCQYSLGALTQTFAGLRNELDLSSVSIANSVIAGLAFGVMVLFNSNSSLFISFYCFNLSLHFLYKIDIKLSGPS